MSDPAPAIGPAKVSSALAQVRVILCQTSLPANIGACARAMKTMGLSNLYLVSPKIFPHPDAETLASRATDILEHAHVCATLDQALSGTIFAAACTARTRDISPEVLAPREMASRMIEATSNGPVALVMGPEKYGLTGEEVGKCSVITSIPANPEYSSLNLAAAVQVFSYEIRQAALNTLPLISPTAAPATSEQLELFYTHLEQTLVEIGFLNPKRDPARMMQRLRRLFARSRLEQEEVNILRGVLALAQTHVGLQAPPRPPDSGSDTSWTGDKS